MRRLLFFVLIFPLNLSAAEATFQVNAEEWASPRHGELVSKMPGLVATVEAFERSDKNKILISYPEGEEGSFWAQELKGWLVSLGISSSRLRLREGSSSDDVIDLVVLETNER